MNCIQYATVRDLHLDILKKQHDYVFEALVSFIRQYYSIFLPQKQLRSWTPQCSLLRCCLKTSTSQKGTFSIVSSIVYCCYYTKSTLKVTQKLKIYKFKYSTSFFYNTVYYKGQKSDHLSLLTVRKDPKLNARAAVTLFGVRYEKLFPHKLSQFAKSR